ncbi:MAG: DUF4332 domain-containing protein [Planctomycetes bacterium]|nr:DUF4332 domain-containing protein [Planctomycetota bacterium]
MRIANAQGIAMRLTSLHLPADQVRLDDLSPGFNVAYAPSSDKRRQVATAVRGALFADADDECSVGLGIQSAWGGFQLTILEGSGSFKAVDSRGRDRGEWLRNRIASNHSAAAFRALGAPRLGDPASLDAAMREVCGEEFVRTQRERLDALLRELDEARPWEGRGSEVLGLRAREIELMRELEQSGDSARAAAAARRRARIEARVRQGRARRADLLSRLEQVRAAIADVQGESARRSVRDRLEPACERLARRIGRIEDQLDQILARIENRPHKPARRRAARAAHARLRELAHRARVLEQRIARLDARHDRLERSVSAHGPACDAPCCRRRDRAEIEAELADIQGRLDMCERGEQRQSSDLLERLRGFIHNRPTPGVLIEASRLLEQLTEGEFIGLRAGHGGREAIVEQPGGKSVTCDVLSRTERVYVHLALCLAAASDMARSGSAYPLILNDATRHMPPARLRIVIEMLRSHCRASGQVLLLTSQQHVATLCRSLGAASYWLARPQPASSTPAGEEPRTGAIRVSRASGQAGRENAWDCEEFPGELADRKHFPNHAPSGDRVVPSESAEADPHRPAQPRIRPESPDPVDPHRSVPGRRVVESVSPTNERPEHDPSERLRVTGHYLELCDRVSEIPYLASKVAKAIEPIGIVTVANLLHAEPGAVVERLADASISAADVRSWQAQARLMCGVRRLRAYDARILVACGIATPEQLADIRPEELHDMVEAFVATPEGSRIVRSGNEQEIKRITRWIRGIQSAKRERGKSRGADDRGEPNRATDSARRAPRAGNRPALGEEPNPHPASHVRSHSMKKGRSERRSGSADGDVLTLRFHLEPTSRVEAAPSIGPAMAKRIEAIGIASVGQLVAADADRIARQLGRASVTGRIVREWQQQAGLVCRIPELRGHDAQILVACGITTPEALAMQAPDTLAAQAVEFARSKTGKRMLRGGKEPTVEEAGHWIAWARQARHLDAA